MGSLLAAVAGAATTTARGGPDDDGGGASREGWGQPRSPPREGGVMPPGGWSVEPQGPSGAAVVTRGGCTAPSGGRRAAAAAEGGVFLGEPGQSATGGTAGLPAAGPPRRTAPLSPPVMSLSGHLIGPEVRRGQGSGEVNKWARDAFLKEAVTWEDFSRYPQVRFRRVRRCVCRFFLGVRARVQWWCLPSYSCAREMADRRRWRHASPNVALHFFPRPCRFHLFFSL